MVEDLMARESDAHRLPLVLGGHSPPGEERTKALIRFVVPIALKEVMEILTPEFTRTSGHRFEIVHRLNPEVPKYIATGVAWDIAITNPYHVDRIIAAGRAAAGSGRPFGRTPLAFAVRGDASIPVRQSIEEIAKTLLSAASIAVTATGTSGATFHALARRLDVWEKIENRVRPMVGGGPMKALLAGDIELAALPLTNIAPVPGVHAIAVCPPEFHARIDLSLCLAPNASRAAHGFGEWLVDPARYATLGALGAHRF